METKEPEDYSKLKLTELKVLCKDRKLPISGTKSELVQRLLGETPLKKSTTALQKNKKELFNTQILKTFETKRKPIVIKRNIWNNFEHIESKLIFNLDKKVIGKQLDDGTIGDLLSTDLEFVEKYHFELDPAAVVSENKIEIITDPVKEEQRIRELLDVIKDN